MYAHDKAPITADNDMSWSDNTTPSPEDIEEIVRQDQSRTSSLYEGHRIMRAPVRRRMRLEQTYRPATPRDYQPFATSTSPMDVRHSMDGSDGSNSSALSLITSTGSSCADPWSSSAIVGEEDGEPDIHWGHDDMDDDMLLVPKIEELDDDLDLNNVKEASLPLSPKSGAIISPVKRPRGRPRKHPLPTPESLAKVAKGRSKTGCITCRKRKKKCDEAKPRCMNCEKNAVICEGYPDRTIWKSGKEKAAEGTTIWTCPARVEELIASTAQLRRVSLPTIKLQPVIHGVETIGDKMFFEHYIYRLSGIFTVEGDRNNAFKSMLLPMAVQHLGLMHSILALSSRHIDYHSPYGVKLLQEHPEVDEDSLRSRSQFHHDEAMKEFTHDIERQQKGDVHTHSEIISARFGQMLCLVLQTLADPNPRGEHRIHLQYYQNLIQESPPEEGPFLEFIKEFFQYHICLDELITLPQGPARLGTVSEDFTLPPIVQPDAVRMLGVCDGLFLYMSKITNIRNQIRENMEAGVDPVIPYNALYRAVEIDLGIKEWTPAWPSGDSRDLAGLLYKQMMWVYLYRTIYPPRTTTWRPDPRITNAVNDGLSILSQFGPRDPSQTLLLAPTFIIGCAAFEPEQRAAIRKAIGIIKEYMQYRNSDSALEVLEEVWRLMDAKDERSWDWQSIAHGMGMDFLAT
jgi:hypothetical protein